MQPTWSIATRIWDGIGFLDTRVFETSLGYDVANNAFLNMLKPSGCLYLVFSFSDQFQATELAVKY